MVRHFDAIIIGTGQAGPPLAKRLSTAGMSVAIIERNKFGGTCVNTGCIPTKTLIASAYAAHVARRGAEYGFANGNVRVDMKRVKARKDEISGQSNRSVEKSLRERAPRPWLLGIGDGGKRHVILPQTVVIDGWLDVGLRGQRMSLSRSGLVLPA